MIFNSYGKQITIKEFTDIIESGRRLVMFLYEDGEWYKFSYVRDNWDRINIDIRGELPC